MTHAAKPAHRLAACVALSGALSGTGCMQAPARDAQSLQELRLHPPASFEVDGKPLCFAGSNNYYAIYKPKPMVDDLFAAAHALHLKVMRVWGMLERGALDGSVPNADGNGQKDGVYFQYWDPALGRPAYNDGADGLERLDYVLDAAARHDIKVIVVLLNNWRPFGGVDQYLMWYGLTKHHQFFSAAAPKNAYRAWLEHVIARKNTVNSRIYREDPTVFGWELANEPRCNDNSDFDSDAGWDKRTLTDWAGEMSAYIKSLDPNHLVSVGDEGFLDGGGQHWAYTAKDGVDHAALTALPDIDFGTYHLYPEDWAAPPGFGESWIADHLRIARMLGKPTVLEEYGIKVRRTHDTLGDVTRGWDQRRDNYRRWNEITLKGGGSATMSWMLAGRDESGALYPDYDHFAYYRDDATGALLGQYAQTFADAPACAVQAPNTVADSPYVRVRHQRSTSSAWLIDAIGSVN